MGAAGVDPARPWLAPGVVTGVVVAAALLLRPSLRALDLLTLGDDTARTLGVEPLVLRRRALGVVSVVVGAVVAATGLIGFVGLVVPHAVRLAVGPGHARLVPLSAAAGGVSVVLADACVSRLAAHLGSELPVGVATAALGGPLFLWLLARHLRGATT
jgi:iron complex transport system permease protein